MKKHGDFLREYVRRLNDDDLKYLSTRMTYRVGSDLGEAVELIQKNQELDRWLAGAASCTAFFDMIDQLDGYIQQETKKRFGFYEQKATKP